MSDLDKKARAQLRSEGVKDRFVAFVKEKGLAEVAKQAGLNYQVLRNSAFPSGSGEDKKTYRPSLDTIFQVADAYPEEFDLLYIMIGELTSGGPIILPDLTQDLTTGNTNDTNQISVLNQRLIDKDELIAELRNDKAFLQTLLQNQSKTN